MSISRASNGRAHFHHAGDRSDQSERASADLRLERIFGQSQAAALEAAGKEGIIYNSTYTNFWQGAMAWSGWWHNEIGLLTEVASARIAAPIDSVARYRDSLPLPQPMAVADVVKVVAAAITTPVPPPTDINARTEYPRPWMGGHWTLRDIVDYEMIATIGAARDGGRSAREDSIDEIYEVNRVTVEAGKKGKPLGDNLSDCNKHDQHEASAAGR